MRGANFKFLIISTLGLALGMSAASAGAQSTRVVDRIVARIEGDVILQSQVRELGAFQQLIEGQAESDDKLLNELIEQWVVNTEASTSHFPQPAQSEADREMTRLQGNFSSSEAYSARLRELGLTSSQVRQMLSRQIHVVRYLDYKFRPSVQVDPSQIDAYYQKELLPELAKKNEPAPGRRAAEEQIRELLVQRGISDLTAKWLDETKSRLKIEITPAPGKS
jgi:parvulin-like peptidyl-prolyl isomerase